MFTYDAIGSKIWEDKSHIKKVDWLRAWIDDCTHTIMGFTNNSRKFDILKTNACNHLCEARFWLGFELERIKNES